MHQQRRACALSLSIAFMSLAACTEPVAVGHPCAPANPDGGVSGTQVHGSFDCTTRLCLSQPGQGIAPPRSTCSTLCERDDDCAPAVSGPASQGMCASGYACAVAMVTGELRCQRLCVCRDDLETGVNADDEGQPMTPSTCQSQ